MITDSGALRWPDLAAVMRSQQLTGLSQLLRIRHRGSQEGDDRVHSRYIGGQINDVGVMVIRMHRATPRNQFKAQSHPHAAEPTSALSLLFAQIAVGPDACVPF